MSNQPDTQSSSEHITPVDGMFWCVEHYGIRDGHVVDGDQRCCDTAVGDPQLCDFRPMFYGPPTEMKDMPWSSGTSFKMLRSLGRACGTGNPDAIQWALDEIDALRDSLTALVVAAGRMLDGWAEGDADVKRHLWQQLHGMAEEADQRHGIYPL